MARKDSWLHWSDVVRDGRELVVLQAASSRGDDPHEYLVAAESCRDAVELLRPHGFHGFRFRADQNLGVERADVDVCVASLGVVMRRRINHVDEPLSVVVRPGAV